MALVSFAIVKANQHDADMFKRILLERSKYFSTKQGTKDELSLEIREVRELKNKYMYRVYTVPSIFSPGFWIRLFNPALDKRNTENLAHLDIYLTVLEYLSTKQNTSSST